MQAPRPRLTMCTDVRPQVAGRRLHCYLRGERERRGIVGRVGAGRVPCGLRRAVPIGRRGTRTPLGSERARRRETEPRLRVGQVEVVPGRGGSAVTPERSARWRARAPGRAAQRRAWWRDVSR
eukprot:scaffold82_cov105-Isochrysis_galbana.AAC.2